jgi:Tol biopolymer transport system component
MNPHEPRLESWKEIGAYLQRDATTARRWEKEEGLPIHRHSHKSRSSVYAYPSEIDSWRAGRKVVPERPAARPLWKIPAFALTILLCLIMVGNGVRPVAAQQAAKSLTARLLMTAPDKTIGIDTVTPDGRFGAGADWSNGDLVVVDLATNGIQRLLPGTLDGRTVSAATAEGRYVAWAVLSPDQRQVAFARYGNPERVWQGELWVMANEPGAKPRLLTRNPEYRNLAAQAWSRDGKSILVNLELVNKSGYQIAWVSVSDGSVKVLKSFGWGLQPDYRLRLSPDGRSIAYSAPVLKDSSNTQIHVLETDGSHETVVTPGSGANESPAWTPDGTHLLFVSDRSGTRDLWAVPFADGKAGKAPVLVKKDIGKVFNAGMTQAGSYVYGVQTNVEFFSIIDAATGGERGAAESFVGLRPTWSPDAKTLAFTRHRASAPDAYDVVVHSMQTGEETIFPFKNGVFPAPPAWFHDGAGFVIVTPGHSEAFRSLYRVDLKTREFTQLFEGMAQQYAPGLFALSPDDKTLYIAGRDGSEAGRIDRILAVDLATKQQRTIFRLPADGSISAFALSPDGRSIALKRDDSSSHLAIVGVDGGGYHEIYTESRAALSPTFGLAWNKDSLSILFGWRANAASWQVMRLPAEGGKPESLGVEAPGQILSVDASADRSRIAVGSTRGTTELWALDNILSVVK